MIYTRRLLNIYRRFLFTEGSNLPYSIILCEWLLTQRSALPCICVISPIILQHAAVWWCFISSYSLAYELFTVAVGRPAAVFFWGSNGCIGPIGVLLYDQLAFTHLRGAEHETPKASGKGRYSDKCFWKGATNTNSNPNRNLNPNPNPNPNPLHCPFRNVGIAVVGIAAVGIAAASRRHQGGRKWK